MASLALLAPACKGRSGHSAKKTPRELVAALRKAARAGDFKAVYGLLDESSRWSVMSIFQAQQRARALVRKHYPAERQAAELRRTHLVATAADPEAYFAAYGRERRLLERLRDLPAAVAAAVDAGSASSPAWLCKEREGWVYCGLRGELEQLKLRAVRDLETLREGLDLQRGG